MTIRDFVTVSLGNLRRMKLRTFLTASGVLIAIAAFVSMLSFGAGNQEYVEKEFNKLGLLTTMQVYTKTSSKESDSTFAKLDENALARLAAVPGVILVYPYDAFSVKVGFRDSSVDSKAQALPSTALQAKLFSQLAAGSAFSNDSTRQAIVNEDLVKKLGITAPDSALGKKIVVSVRVSTIDSALFHVLVDRNETILDRIKRIHFDSLFNKSYRQKVIHDEATEALRRFIFGFVSARATISDTLTVCGVRQMVRGGRLRIEPLIIPFATAAKFRTGGLGGSPTEMFTALSSGQLFDSRAEGKGFSQVTINFDPKVPYQSVRDSIEAMGYKTFSFAAEFEEIQRVFLYFDLALGVVGLIALMTASLGIVNTMVMSITERRREIGILKSLGADDRDIRLLFLVESGVIGCIGTIGGILFGWVLTRIVSAIAQAYMTKEGVPAIDLFSLPVWLILIALSVGVGVSVLAGLYPAGRASRVDPIEALRND